MEKPLEIRAILSKNVKKYRNILHYSQEKLAEASGLSVQTINDIEGGRKWVSDKTITKISAALQVECYQLLLPCIFPKKKKEATPTQQFIDFRNKIHKSLDLQIESHFNDFIKSGFFDT